MKNSYSFTLLSTKSLKDNQIIKSHKFNKEFNSLNLNLAKSNSSSNLLLDKQSFTTFNKKNNDVNLKNIFNKLASSFYQKVKKKYRNLYIFEKREIAYNKSIQEGRKVFKYDQSIELMKSSKRNRGSFNSLYLTESLNKSTKNQTSLPLLEKDKSLNEEYQTSIINNNKNINLSRNSFINISTNILNKKNKTISENINKDDIILLKRINLNETKDNDYLKRISLIKKQKILERNMNKNYYKKKYINDERNLILDKYNINIKKEKIKVIEENLNNKIKKINNDIKQLELNSELFKLNFMPKLNEYYRYIRNKKDIENQKNLLYINKIYLLKKHILFIKSRITKRQKEKEFLMREIFLQISIKEKRLNLPEYYKDILLNDYSYEQIKEKYGNEINKEEYNRISKYIESLDVNDMEIIFENLNKLTNNNMELLHEYNKIQEKNLNYKKHRKKIEIEINSDAQKEINNLIKEKESILNIKIKKYKENKKIYFDLTNDISYKNSLGKKRSNLFIKLDSFLKMLKDNLNYKINTEDDIKGKITEEKIMMNYLEKIEIIINRFLSVHKGIKNNYSDKIKSLKSIFDKEKKFRKAQEQKKNIALKFETDRKKLFDRYNKILFLPKKKVYYKKPNKTITFEEKFEKFEEKGNKIEDFLFD